MTEMSMKEFSQLWLYCVVGPTSALSLAWLVRFRMRRARQLSIKFWSLQVIRPAKEDDKKVRLVGSFLLAVTTVGLLSELAWKFHFIK